MGKSDKYITVKNITIVAVILIIVLISVIISLAVRHPPSHSPASRSVACPDSWIGYRGKCFYMSKDERNWSLSLTTCSSFNASLAVIDSQEELEFWRIFFQHIHYWFGLSKEDNIWKWSNGTNFKNQFSMRAEGFCAYVDEKGASSTICAVEKHFFCSRPESCRKSR
ncbi:C-type lectin domain family 2 member D-like isoform X2 [Erythrolamprus reginae]|uniref:C-type lectin domain family 2 member D-like isoform X2 n=1 Tax=Erythrolamprus reginae TaxID=121349 RepID=UPI00396CBF33